jgi:glycopeptide antibiotics resistance protein
LNEATKKMNSWSWFASRRLIRLLAVVYFAIICIVLLYPFKFVNAISSRINTASVQSDGIHFGTSGELRTVTAPVSLYDRLITGEGLTVELLVRTASAEQGGPARIISYSLDPWHRNFTIGQEGHALITRLRTSQTDQNGTNPSLSVLDAFQVGATQHVVVTYNFQRQAVYIDGKLRIAAAVPQGDFKTWDRSSFLVFGNEATGARAWNGTIVYAAIYDRALDESTIDAHFQATWSFRSQRGHAPLVAFEFARGLDIADPLVVKSTLAHPIPPLVKPEFINTHSRAIFSFFRGADGKLRLVEETSVWDIVRNVILFVPFGLFVAASLKRTFRSTAATVFMTILIGTLVSAGFEGLQFFLERTSSIFDVTTNLVGTACGSALLCIQGPIAGRLVRSIANRN